MDTELAIKKVDDKLNVIIDMMKEIIAKREGIMYEDDSSDYYLSERERKIVERNREEFKRGNYGVSIEDINKERTKNGLAELEV